MLPRGRCTAPISNLTTSNTICSPAIGVDDLLLVTGYNNQLFALELATGLLRWTFMGRGALLGAPVVSSSGVVYLGCAAGGYHAVDGRTGTALHSNDTVGVFTATGALKHDDSVLYLGSSDNNVYAFNTTSGALLWKAATNGMVVAAPVVDGNGDLYVGSMDHWLYAISGATGTRRWAFPTWAPISGPVAIDATGILFVMSNDGNAYAVGL